MMNRFFNMFKRPTTDRKTTSPIVSVAVKSDTTPPGGAPLLQDKSPPTLLKAIANPTIEAAMDVFLLAAVTDCNVFIAVAQHFPNELATVIEGYSRCSREINVIQCYGAQHFFKETSTKDYRSYIEKSLKQGSFHIFRLCQNEKPHTSFKTTNMKILGELTCSQDFKYVAAITSQSRDVHGKPLPCEVYAYQLPDRDFCVLLDEPLKIQKKREVTLSSSLFARTPALALAPARIVPTERPVAPASSSATKKM